MVEWGSLGHTAELPRNASIGVGQRGGKSRNVIAERDDSLVMRRCCGGSSEVQERGDRVKVYIRRC